MSAPPEDAPPPEEQDAGLVDAGFEVGPPVASLCGFVIPSFTFDFSINIPFDLPPFPPKFYLDIGINCDLDNPLDVSAGLDWGGGRKPQPDTTPDPDEGAEV